MLDNDIRIIKDSEGRDCKVIIRNSVIKKGSQPKEIIIDDKLLGAIEGMAITGTTIETIARALNIDIKVFQYLYRKKTKVWNAVKSGKAKGVFAVNKAFYDVATDKKGNVAAKVAWLGRNEEGGPERPKVLNKNQEWEMIDRLNLSEAQEKYYESHKVIEEINNRQESIENKKEGYEQIFYGNNESK